MKRFILICIIISFPLFSNSSPKIYWVDKDLTLLAFVGKPTSSSVTPKKIVTYEKQQIKLFHKKSGRGIYAFYLKGLITRDYLGLKAIEPEGFFLVKRKNVRLSRYKKKVSKKYETRKVIVEKKPKSYRYYQMEGDLK